MSAEIDHTTSPAYFMAAGQRVDIDVERCADLTERLDAIESRYLRTIRLRQYGERVAFLTIRRDEIPGLIGALGVVLADTEGDDLA